MCQVLLRWRSHRPIQISTQH